MPSPDLFRFVTPQALTTLLKVAQWEDLGPQQLDVTSDTLIPEAAQTTATFHSRETGTLAGLAILPTLLAVYDPTQTVTLQTVKHDGDKLAPGDAVATLSGPLRLVLKIERVALNLLGHLSGVASLTAEYAQHCQDTAAHIYDTRKTLPGLRGLQKYAVACGGGRTHRMGLHDAVLVKDNHLAHLPLAEYTQALSDAIAKARQLNANLAFAMVEVDTLEQLRVVLPAEGLNLVLLDNMPPDVLRQAVALRDELAPSVELEASGGINLTTVGPIAQTGVDRISVGALTHSATNLDLGLDIA